MPGGFAVDNVNDIANAIGAGHGVPLVRVLSVATACGHASATCGSSIPATPIAPGGSTVATKPTAVAAAVAAAAEVPTVVVAYTMSPRPAWALAVHPAEHGESTDSWQCTQPWRTPVAMPESYSEERISTLAAPDGIASTLVARIVDEACEASRVVQLQAASKYAHMSIAASSLCDLVGRSSGSEELRQPAHACASPARMAPTS